jgi:hypothetical protein
VPFFGAAVAESGFVKASLDDDFHRALLAAGDDADLVFEVIPHAFWYHFELPETMECLNLMAKYFDKKLGR